MKIGVEVLLTDERRRLQGKRIGLVTNMTGVDHKLVSTIDLLYEDEELELSALFAPEHGIRGDEEAGKHIDTFTDERTSLPVYSLYGKSKKPAPEVLKEIDVMLLDLQDVGSRYYTYIYTMAHVMQACGEQGVPMLILDRPNPIGGQQVEGNYLETKTASSFLNQFPIPNRHGMTIGELALLFVHKYGLKCDTDVIPMDGWKRHMYFDDTGRIWVPPSPNTTGLHMCLLYPGTCLIEGLNVSEGRGTAFPFEYVGAPFLDGYRLAQAFNSRKLPGVIARPASFIPSQQKHAGKLCSGVQLHVIDRHTFEALHAGLVLMEAIMETALDDVHFLKNGVGTYSIDHLARTNEVRNHVLTGTVDTFWQKCVAEAESFQKISSRYYLYS
ncbi:DUF1343 domain-containing protein [Lederbergia sp. NSJ-179]|uniref:exo-beta-N-acetylmuramidase NamZ family protein n=1 Tax=Lederbergia sp. NSJ-179 TaxID=2931402 RepID=UPI001FD16D8D|nr:DUF1343 domain-containing protein [Lederbergia sp. NSJ-179]MCJ7841528.1 DUF1343 domain-containing protein [Lederbergia sp. NSJ-179]